MSTETSTFRSSGSLVFGVITVVGLLTLAVLAAVHPDAGAPGWISAALVLLALVVYVASVRPAVVLEDSELVLRNMLSSVHVPWPLVGEVRVRQFLTVEAEDETYDCAAVGRTRRQIYRDAKNSGPRAYPDVGSRPDLIGRESASPAELSFGRFVETKIRNRAEEARRRAAEPSGEVRLVRAWPEIAALALTAVVFVALILV